ncbi:MAG: hypothetical protein ABI450_05840 [Rhizomicrobium sp.]
MKQRSPPSKSCGECNLCCTELPIETPELRKKAQTPCSHLTAKGCGIYETRFPICRQFLCGWMLFPELDADWRPDRSGILILQVAQASIPKIYQPAGHGVQLLITGGEAAVTRPGFAEYVLDQVSRGVAVYMTATTPRALLNEYLQPLAAPENLPAARRIILHLYRLLMAAKAGKGFLGMLPYFYRLHVEKQRAALKK